MNLNINLPSLKQAHLKKVPDHSKKGLLLSIQNLPKKQIYEINKEVEKARLLKASQAKNPSMVILQNMSFLLLQIKRATTQMVK